MRTVNIELYRRWLSENEKALALLEVKTGVGQTTLRKIEKGHCPGKVIRDALASAMGLSVEDLFPLAREEAS